MNNDSTCTIGYSLQQSRENAFMTASDFLFLKILQWNTKCFRRKWKLIEKDDTSYPRPILFYLFARVEFSQLSLIITKMVNGEGYGDPDSKASCAR